ncbi:MAG: hypothetical protein KJ904_14100 [Alphaproteobacteria bacterium]|nr:hypothetical protein [Alphaproteobacteria bacterium]
MKKITAFSLLSMMAAGTAVAQTDSAALERFVKQSQPLCERQPAQQCIDAFWSYADLDRDNALNLSEVQRIRSVVELWVVEKGKTMPPRDRSSILMGIMMVDSAGLPTLFNNYDTSGDGKLSQKELFADVKLDNRPLPQILADRNAVDMPATKVKLGALGPLLDGMLTRR